MAINKYKSSEKALQQFFIDNSKLFNLSELERVCDFTPASLRHISAGNRDLTRYQYESVRKIICPKLCELIFILQNY